MTSITDEEIHDVFVAFDDCKNGTMAVSDVRSALSLLGMDITESELRDSFNDAINTLTEEDFTKYIKDCLRQLDFKARCVDCFNYLNDDEEGIISRDMIKSVLTQRGTEPVSSEDAEQLMKELGVDGAGPFKVSDIVDILYQKEEGEEMM